MDVPSYMNFEHGKKEKKKKRKSERKNCNEKLDIFRVNKVRKMRP